MELKYQIFGSRSSQDYDVLLAVDELKSIDENHTLIKEWNNILEKRFVEAGLPHKKVNCNLGVFHRNQLIKVFKGTYDEVNNSLYYTYGFHTQFYHNMVTVPYDRTNDHFKHLKLKRCYRFLLSFYSRVPELREEIKLALKGNFVKRHEVLQKIDFTVHTEFPKKKDKIEDIYKVIAFQFAQTIALVKDEQEIYSKEDAIEYYPQLKNLLLRKPVTETDLIELNLLLTLLLVIGTEELPRMKKEEYNWWTDPKNKEQVERISWWNHAENQTTVEIPVALKATENGGWVISTNDETKKLLGDGLHSCTQGKTKEEAIRRFFYILRITHEFSEEERLKYQRWVPFRRGPWSSIGGKWFAIFGIHFSFRYDKKMKDGKRNMKGGKYIPFTKLNISVHSNWATYKRWKKKMEESREKLNKEFKED